MDNDNNADNSTQSEAEINLEKSIIIDVKASKKEASVGDEIVFTIDLSSKEKIASCAFKLSYDVESFELVKCEMFKDALISNFADSIGVIAFSKPMVISAEVMTFTLKSKKIVEKTTITCNASIKGENDKSIDDIELNGIDIAVK